ncbi:MAG: cytidyltransferase [Rickettsiales bacterium]|nr:cytidyltransferase [Rickettsiales bacterium]
MVIERFPSRRHTQPESISGPGEKLKSIDHLGLIVANMHRDGKNVVLCHGVFDLLHMGHVRHLSEAKSHGDVLIVSITADAFVNKGPGKPVFSENLRAEMLSSLAVVDYVTINRTPDAEGLLEVLQPNFYVKGSDYRDEDTDITGKISLERKAVETYGGKLVFTNNITFSSTELLNRHFEVFEPQVRDFLNRMRDAGGLTKVLNLLEQIKSLKVLVIGDAIIDEYRYVTPMGKSPKENMIATRFEESESFAGGAIATANHISGLCDHVDLLTCLGDAEDEQTLIEESLNSNVNLYHLQRRQTPTTRKIRFIDQSYFRKLFEVYHFDDSPLAQAQQYKFDDIVREKTGDYDLVIVNDFGHGLIAASTIELLSRRAKFLAINAQSNSANFGFNLITRYPKADLVCIDTPEAQLAVGSKFMEPAEMVGRALPAAINCDRIILTLGRGGCSTWAKAENVESVPAFTKTVVDLVGAGDAFLAASAPIAAVGGSMQQVGFVGNVAGALKVGIVGHRRSIDRSAIVKSILGLLK